MSEMIKKEAIPNLKAEFRSKRPYGYASAGDLFNRTQLSKVASEIIAHIESIPEEKNIYASHKKFKQSSLELMPPDTKKFLAYLNSQEFIDELEEITGISDLHGDPELRGGGVHAIGRGGFLKLHTDFNWHPSLNMHRRLNLLIYLNEPWESGWKGAIELWDESVTNKQFSLGTWAPENISRS